MIFKSMMKSRVRHSHPEQLNLPLANGKIAAVTVKRHSAARKMKIRISRATSEVILTLPQQTPMALADSFLHDSRDWIEKQLADSLTPLPVTSGMSIPVMGEEHTITPDPDSKRGIRITPQKILVPADDTALIASRVKRGLLSFARNKIEDLIAYHGATMGVSTGKIGLGDMQTRWGSCSAKGNLKFNFRLIMAPPHILDYVVVHELAHRKHMDHSAAFWHVVADHFPDYKQAKADLKHWSAELRRYQF